MRNNISLKINGEIINLSKFPATYIKNTIISIPRSLKCVDNKKEQSYILNIHIEESRFIMK